MRLHVDGELRLRPAVGTQQVVLPSPAVLQRHEVGQPVIYVHVIHRTQDARSRVNRQLNDGVFVARSRCRIQRRP